MTFKMSIFVLCAFLINFKCWAASNPKKFKLKLRQKLETLSQKSELINRFPRDNRQVCSDAMMDCIDWGNVCGLAFILLHTPVSPEYTDLVGNFPLLRVIDGINYSHYPYTARLGCLTLLLECGADPNRKVKFRRPLVGGDSLRAIPLIFRAVEISRPDVVELLLKYGADATVVDEYGGSIFQWLDAVYKKNYILRETARIQILLEEHFFLLVRNTIKKKDDEAFMKALMSLVSSRRGEMKSVLAGRDVDGMSLLHLAVMERAEKMVQMLLMVKAPVNVQDREGATPLHYAAFLGYREIIEMLVKAGASWEAKDKYGNKPVIE